MDIFSRGRSWRSMLGLSGSSERMTVMDEREYVLMVLTLCACSVLSV